MEQSVKLIPYSVYLPAEYHAKIKELAKNRKASETVRDALKIILDGNDAYKGGFNKAIEDVINVIDSIKEIEVIAIRGVYLNDLIVENIKRLKP